MMKQIAMAMMAAMSLFATLKSSASTGPGDELGKAIRRNISYPEFAKAGKLKGMVMVKFELDSLGQITVKEINASHAELGTYVTEELAKLKVKSADNAGTHYVRFSFKFMDI